MRHAGVPVYRLLRKVSACCGSRGRIFACLSSTVIPFTSLPISFTPRSPFFFLNDPATTEISPLSLHDALPISDREPLLGVDARARRRGARGGARPARLPRHPPRARYGVSPRRRAPRAAPAPGHHPSREDRKSTRLNSSH